MTKEVRYCFGDQIRDVILDSCEDCFCQSTCEGHTKYIVKFLPLIIQSIKEDKMIKRIRSDERIIQLKDQGISTNLLKSDWCLDCKNVYSLLGACPENCDGSCMENKKGYIKDKKIHVDI